MLLFVCLVGLIYNQLTITFPANERGSFSIIANWFKKALFASLAQNLFTLPQKIQAYMSRQIQCLVCHLGAVRIFCRSVKVVSRTAIRAEEADRCSDFAVMGLRHNVSTAALWTSSAVPGFEV